MDHSIHNKIVSFIWPIADDCLRDVFVRGKYRDVILPMFVLRRLDVLLEPTKAEVLEEVRFQRVEAGFSDLESQGLCDASGYVFFNTSQFTLKALLGNPSQLEANFKNYIDGFSANVKEIIDHFDLRNLSRKMATADVLHNVIEKFVSEEINLSPEDKTGPDGRPQPGLSNLGMGYVFEELIRRFNEENNEEAGEHFTPREVIELMTHIIFMPVKDSLPPVITIYDPACGSGGMLTEAQNFIIDPDGGIQATADTYLYGKEVNGETYAICKSDMMIKGNSPENIRYGSTLASDEFAGTRFDFMLSNPPYGKSWKTDQKYIKDGKDVIDPRFEITLKNYDGSENIEAAAPVIKKQHKLSGDKLHALLEQLGTTVAHLPDFGYWPTDKAGVYLEYESDADLRDSESIPLNAPIHDYFLNEVRPHVADAWLNMDSVKIGYEISFNKYFYAHTPLRPLAEVTAEILALEQETEGLLKEIVELSQV